MSKHLSAYFIVEVFMAYNLNIRGYTPDEYVCGQYTVDMINASKKAGFKAYFGAIRFSDGTGDKDPTTWRFAYPLYNKKY